MTDDVRASAPPLQPCVTRSFIDGVAHLVIHNPPVNAINSRVRRVLRNSLDGLATDERVVCVVISASGDMFSGGGDLRELGQPAPADDVALGDLALLIERFEKPVVIALHGKVIGGGVLLAMACHARVAAPDTELALPEVNLGFVPGAGGTQRLPRLVGVEPALRMVAQAISMDPPAALAAGLVDLVTPEAGSMQQHASEVALAIARGSRPWRRTAALSVPGGSPSDAAIAAARHAATERFPDREAPQAAIDLIALAATRPFEEGVLEERATFLRLSSSQQTRALLDSFFAARAAARARKAAAGAA
ncbi:MAG: enoyl-CoA hydratase/isomerase family protein [Burkholderiaceae bacterium]|nr:enoyl-CoA hydratase/isomerase family protein [Burkholderiaceae bacterium]